MKKKLSDKFIVTKGLVVCFFWFFFLAQNGFAQFSVTDRSPGPNSTTAASSQTITITFNQNVNASSLNGNIFVDGSVSGSITGNLSLTSPNVAEFTPSQAFSEGEKISVTVTNNVEASNGSSLNNPSTWLFYVEPFVGSIDYSSPQIYTLRQGSEPSGIKAVDLSNNGAPDLVVVNSNNRLITILENTTQISDDFEIVSEIETGIDSGGDVLEQEVQAQASTLPVNSSITSADLNNNGNTDVIVAATLANELIILRNPSADPANLQLDFIDTGERPVQVISGDFNGNGAIDLAVAAIGSDQIFIHYNNGNGSFNNTQVENVGLAPSSIAAEDINGDGFLDIAIAISGENRVEGLINQGNGNFNRSVLIDDLSFTPSFLVTGNFQQDSGNEFADFILGSTDEELFYVFENSGGNLLFVGSWNSGDSSRPLFVVPGDLDSNGTLDLISTHFNSDDLAVNEFESSGAFGNRTIIDGNTSGPLGISTADLNLGGSMDIAITNSTNNQVSIYFNNFDQEVCEDLVGGLSFPGQVNFGAIELNTTATRDFQISNNSSVSFDVTLEIVDGDNFDLESPSEFTLSIGSERTVTVSFTPDQIAQYSDELVVRVTSVCGTETFTIDLLGEVGEPLPDLVATDLTPTSFESEYFLGVPYNFEGVFRLDGEVEVSDDFDVEFLINDAIQNTVRETETIQPGQSYAYPMSLTFTETGSTTLTFSVDSGEEIEEIDETNNEISITINVVEGEMKVSPNPFTPNNDGFNDQVRFDFSQLANINNPEIKIFSFNGRLVRTFNPDDFSGGLIPWDGTDESGNRLQPGVYLYVVQNNNQLILKGSVTLAL